MKLISFLVPLSTKPTAFFFLTSAQYRTHRPQWMQNEASFSKRSLSAPYSSASSCNAGNPGREPAAAPGAILRILSIFSDRVLTTRSSSTG